MGEVIDIVSGGLNKLFGGKDGDDASLKAAQQQALSIHKEAQEKARLEAARAGQEKAAAEEAQRKKKANVAASGRKSTLLAGDNAAGKTALGS
jgi:hypothetical protein